MTGVRRENLYRGALALPEIGQPVDLRYFKMLKGIFRMETYIKSATGEK